LQSRMQSNGHDGMTSQVKLQSQCEVHSRLPSPLRTSSPRPVQRQMRPLQDPCLMSEALAPPLRGLVTPQAQLRKCSSFSDTADALQVQNSPDAREVMFTVFHSQSELGCSPQVGLQASHASTNFSVATKDVVNTPQNVSASCGIRASPSWSMSPQPQLATAAHARFLNPSASSNVVRLISSPVDPSKLVAQSFPVVALPQTSRPSEPAGKDGVHMNLDKLQSLLQEFKGQQVAQQPTVDASPSAFKQVSPDGMSIVTVPKGSNLPRMQASFSSISAVTVPQPGAGAVTSTVYQQAAVPTTSAAVRAPSASANSVLEAFVPEGPRFLPPQRAASPLRSSRGLVTPVVSARDLGNMAAAAGSMGMASPQVSQPPWLRPALVQNSAIRESSRHSPLGAAGMQQQQQQSRSFSQEPIRLLPASPALQGTSTPGLLGAGFVGMQFPGLGQGLLAAIPTLPFSDEPAPPIPMDGELPPPPRCAPAAFNFQAEIPTASRIAPADTQPWPGPDDCPPPPRCAPASSNLCWTGSSFPGAAHSTQRLGSVDCAGVGDDFEVDAGLTRTAVRSVASPGACQQPVLRVQMAEEIWEPFAFTGSKSLEQQAAMFLRQHLLKDAFQGGLVSKMQRMLALGQQDSSVDIVDLI